nr:reverse transcriptase domain-containing protein [Tanacetum cinerariifolium]
MEDNRTMAQMLQAPIEGYEDAIVVPQINSNNFELKQTLINLVQSNQFTGRQDPHNHLCFFIKVTSTFRHPEVPNTMIKLLLFHVSLEGEARIWLDKEPPRSIMTWEDLVSKFINQFFPPSTTSGIDGSLDRGREEPQKDAPIKGRSMKIGEEVRVERSTELGSNDTEEMVNVLSSMEAAILTSGVVAKKKLQEQIDAQVAKEMEEDITRENQWMNEQIARDAKIARIHAEEKLKMLIDGLDRSNEVIAKHLQEMKTSEDVFKEDLKGMMQLVPVEEVYVKALQVKHHIIDWEIHSMGKKDYWKIIRLGGHTTVYQQASSDKEKELWVKPKRMFEPDFEDQLWTHNQNLMHDPLY